MNRRIILNAIGIVLRVEAVLMLLPTAVGIFYGEKAAFYFFLTSLICFLVGYIPNLLFKPRNSTIFAKEGFITVAFTWILLSLFGAMPFVISGEIPSFTNAFFETVSGFTTTGASVITDLESLSHCTLFWRSFTHWIGGMGILVFVMAILPNISERPIHILRAEIPGPIKGKLVPRVKDTAVILYLIYIAMTVIETVLLILGGMPIFESIVHAFGTAGTGGFGIKSDSISGYSPYIQWVITAFMLLFSANFNIYYLILIRRFRSAFKSSELWCFFGIVAVAVTAITANISHLYNSFSDSLRASAFQVSSVISTTGYCTADFNRWPTFSKIILFLLMFMGGCAGSTAGGLKMSRIVIMFKQVSKEIKHLIHPRSVGTIHFEGKPIDTATSKNISNYFIIYSICYFAITLLISFEPFSFETVVSASAACFNNVGPGFGAVGPAGSYADFSNFSKYILSLAMLLGRLEIFPIIIALSPSSWSKSK